jgi:hypothetical protein
LPNYVSITTGTMPLEVVLQQLLVVFWPTEVEAIAIQPLGAVVPTFPLPNKVFCHHLALLWNHFASCKLIAKWYGWKNYAFCKSFSVNQKKSTWVIWLNMIVRSKQDKVGRRSKRLHFNLVPLI